MITNNTITARFAADRHATIAAAAAEIGIDRVRAIVATLAAYRVAMHDRRISDDTAAWAQTIADALDADAAERVGLITDAIHPAHLDQLARATAEYVEPETVETVETAETTTETTETTPAAEPETEAETETAERAAEINPMCTDCTRRGSDCDGTACMAWTGCVNRKTAYRSAAEFAAARRARGWAVCKRDLLALAGGGCKPLRWVCIRYKLGFYDLDPYCMGAELMAGGVRIVYDDTAISPADNRAEQRRVQRAYMAREGARA